VYSVYLVGQEAKEVVGIEEREIDYQRCLIVKESLNLSNVTFYKPDVRDVKMDWLGDFDIVFVGGILYHFDDPFALLKKISEMTAYQFQGFFLEVLWGLFASYCAIALFRCEFPEAISRGGIKTP